METACHKNYTRITNIVLVLLFLATLKHELQAAPLGTAFTYQGRLSAGGQPANGTYDLRLILYDAEAGGSQVGPLLTNAAVLISNGLFTTALDFGAGAVAGNALWLEIGVRTNGIGDFTMLSPRQSLTPAPHALYAATAPIADGAVTSAKIADGSVASADLAANAVTSAKVLDGTLTGADLSDNTVGSAQLADTIALGSSSVNGQLDVYRTIAGTPGVSLVGAGSTVSTYGADGLEQTRLWGSTYGELLLNNSLPNNATAVTLSANGNLGGVLGLSNSNGVERARLEGLNTGGALSLWDGDGSLGLNFSATDLGGSMLVHDGAGTATVRLRGDGGGRIDAAGSFHLVTALGGTDQLSLSGGSWGGRLQTSDEFGRQTSLYGSSSAAGGFLQLYQSNGVLTVNLDGDATGANGGGALTLIGTNSSARVTLLSQGAAGGGELRLSNTNGGTRLSVFGQGANGAGEINVFDTTGTETIEILGQQSSALGSRITLRQSSGVASMTLDGEYGSAGEGSAILLNNGAGVQRLRLEGDFNDAGYVVVSGTNGAANVILSGNAAGRGRVTTEELQIASVARAVNAGETLIPGPNYMRIYGSTGYVTLNTTTAIANGTAIGTILILEGLNDSAQVTIGDNANTRLSSAHSLGANDTLALIWNGADWVELSFSNN